MKFYKGTLLRMYNSDMRIEHCDRENASRKLGIRLFCGSFKPIEHFWKDLCSDPPRLPQPPRRNKASWRPPSLSSLGSKNTFHFKRDSTIQNHNLIFRSWDLGDRFVLKFCVGWYFQNRFSLEKYLKSTTFDFLVGSWIIGFWLVLISVGTICLSTSVRVQRTRDLRYPPYY